MDHGFLEHESSIKYHKLTTQFTSIALGIQFKLA